jgi:hypothetical protein
MLMKLVMKMPERRRDNRPQDCARLRYPHLLNDEILGLPETYKSSAKSRNNVLSRGAHVRICGRSAHPADGIGGGFAWTGFAGIIDEVVGHLDSLITSTPSSYYTGIQSDMRHQYNKAR